MEIHGSPSYRKLLNSRLNNMRLEKLYNLEREWRNVAFDQTIKNIKKIESGRKTVSDLTDKLSTEVNEMEGALTYYLGSKTKYNHEYDALQEICDVANMAQILMPINIRGKPVELKLLSRFFPAYPIMLNSVHYHKDRFRVKTSVSFDESYNYSRSELFETYLKTIEDVQIQETKERILRSQIEKKKVETPVEAFRKNYIMLGHDIDEYLDQEMFKDWGGGIRMEPKWLRMMGDVENRTLILLRQVMDAPYEKFYEQAIKKMKDRDNRYHGKNDKEQGLSRNTDSPSGK